MDEINKKLDQFEEDGDYRGMINYILQLPQEQITLDTVFAMVSAMINTGDYNAAKLQLKEVFPLCKEPPELAQVFYYSGYAVTQLGGNPVLGLSLFKEALANDPKDELGLEIEQECRDCVDKINTEIAKFHELCGRAAAVIKEKALEAKSGAVLEGRELLFKLSFLSIFRQVPVLGESLSSDGSDVPLEGEKRSELAEWLDNAIGIHDYESTAELFEKSKIFNVSVMVNDALAFIKGTPNFDPDILDRRSRDGFEIFSLLVRCFEDYLPPAGVLGWDIAKRTAIMRFAYIAGIISEEEYNALADELLTAAKSLSDPADFLASLLFGSALATYDAKDSSIAAACRSIDLTMTEIVDCGLFGSTFMFS